MSTTLRASTVGRSRRRPRTYGPDRVCSTESCTVRLSQYNRAENCFAHAPKRYPRLRGEFTEDFLAKQG